MPSSSPVPTKKQHISTDKKQHQQQQLPAILMKWETYYPLFLSCIIINSGTIILFLNFSDSEEGNKSKRSFLNSLTVVAYLLLLALINITHFYPASQSISNEGDTNILPVTSSSKNRQLSQFNTANPPYCNIPKTDFACLWMFWVIYGIIYGDTGSLSISPSILNFIQDAALMLVVFFSCLRKNIIIRENPTTICFMLSIIMIVFPRGYFIFSIEKYTYVITKLTTFCVLCLLTEIKFTLEKQAVIKKNDVHMESESFRMYKVDVIILQLKAIQTLWVLFTNIYMVSFAGIQILLLVRSIQTINKNLPSTLKSRTSIPKATKTPKQDIQQKQHIRPVTPPIPAQVVQQQQQQQQQPPPQPQPQPQLQSPPQIQTSSEKKKRVKINTRKNVVHPIESNNNIDSTNDVVKIEIDALMTNSQNAPIEDKKTVTTTTTPTPSDLLDLLKSPPKRNSLLLDPSDKLSTLIAPPTSTKESSSSSSSNMSGIDSMLNYSFSKFLPPQSNKNQFTDVPSSI